MSAAYSRRIALKAHKQARSMGHIMEALQDDTHPDCYVAMCWTCGEYLAYDPWESREPYGGVLRGPCQGGTIEIGVDR